jgi:hypothetical protein
MITVYSHIAGENKQYTEKFWLLLYISIKLNIYLFINTAILLLLVQEKLNICIQSDLLVAA